MEKSPVKQTVFFMLMLVISANCMITNVNVIEGDLAFLNFTYSCNSTEVTIQRGNGAPFYSSRSLTPPSSSNLKLRNETDGKVCFLYLTINPVTRDDQGGYIFTAYKDDPTELEDNRIQLWVGYPPGKASCSLNEEYIDRDWVRLQCTAPLGNIGGFIMCYQNGIRIPPLNSPQEHDQILSQTMIARLGDLVYCCSSTLDQTKDCECKDSIWDPTQNKQVTNVPDPCPPTVPIQYSTFSGQPTEIDEFELTSPSTKTLTGTPPQIDYGKALVSGLIVVICLLIMVIVVIIAVMLYSCKKHQMKPANHREENGVQESFIFESVMKV